jgi:hypothetical protein
MSVLIDKLLKEADASITAQAKDLKWYLAKPLPFYSLKTKLKRLKDSFRVMNGKIFCGTL